jgi:phosphatidylinositol-3-phosphatase
MRTHRLLGLLAGLAGLAATAGGVGASASAATPTVGHIFVINLENKGFTETWGSGSVAPYLSQTLRAQGDLLTNYYGIGHNSLPNYIAEISGQPPNLSTQADCSIYSAFGDIGTTDGGAAIGQGCVYTSSVKTVADQLTAAGLSWKSYDEGMTTACQHPSIGATDPNFTATATDEYATRHNPFVYFQSITGSSGCAANDVPLTALTGDLSSASTTANLTFITPNLCNDGHDSPCADGRTCGLVSADAWLTTWVPVILNSPAYKNNGMLVITFDESDGATSDSSACCNEESGPNTLLPGILGPGGGRVGALVLSPFTTAGSSDANPYNHYSLLRTIEDTFGLSPLGYAAEASSFSADVLTN